MSGAWQDETVSDWTEDQRMHLDKVQHQSWTRGQSLWLHVMRRVNEDLKAAPSVLVPSYRSLPIGRHARHPDALVHDHLSDGLESSRDAGVDAKLSHSLQKSIGTTRLCTPHASHQNAGVMIRYVR